MSQNDFTIANQSFPAFRADLNSALQALASNNSGDSEPTTTFANMWWYDSANNIMYIRNEDNDAFIKFAELDQTNDKFVLSGTLQLDDGTVSAPALTFNSDTNMGIYRGGTDILKFVTAGTDAITIDASQGVTLAGNLDVSSGTIKLDGNYPVGSNNVALGDQALDNVTTGSDNTAIGHASLTGLTDGDFNTALGDTTLAVNTGSSNTAIGREALKANTTADDNVAVGRFSMGTNTTGTDNVAVGSFSLDANTTGNYNVAIGRASLGGNTTANNNTAVGYLALHTSTTASDNNAFGKGSLQSATTGGDNSAFGVHTLHANTTGASNVAMGHYALDANTTGANNVGIGSGALGTNTTGSPNTAIGYQAGYSNTTAIRNTFVGYQSGFNTTTGSTNNAFGHETLLTNATGVGNCAFGQQSLKLVTGSSNSGYGYATGVDVTTGTNNLFLGNNAGRSTSPSGSVTTGSNNVVLGDNSITNLYCADTSISSSDSRDKADITNFTAGLDFVTSLNPVTYKWDKRVWYVEDNASSEEVLNAVPDGTHKRDKLHIGFLAQDVLALEQSIGYATNKENMLTVNLNEDDTAYGLKYERLVPILVNAIKELKTKNDALEARLSALENG